MQLEFTKMHGLGNDFVVIDTINQSFLPTQENCRVLADRHFGVGCDQILLVESPNLAATEFHYRIFNADGSEVEQCGNGARCFARFVRQQGLTKNDEIVVGTSAGVIRLFIEDERNVRVNMGVPRLEPTDIPFDAIEQAASYRLEVDDRKFRIGAVSMGNPHAIFQVDDVDVAELESLAPKVECHARFPNRVNVGFMQVMDTTHVRLRVYERGVGETLACGTGACAAVVAGRIQGLLDTKVRVSLPGGELEICWEGVQQPVWMTGPAISVFEGRIEV